MEAIEQLKHDYFLLAFDVGDFHNCVNWAIDRLRHDQEGEDLDIILLAAATTREEALPLVEQVVARYCGMSALDDELAAGKYVAHLRSAYLQGQETIESLDSKLIKLYFGLGYPDWLVMLSRNCEYATDIPAFEESFEKEFAYIAELWASSGTRSEFESKYSRAVSDQHDVS